jgi:hypothetical protein
VGASATDSSCASMELMVRLKNEMRRRIANVAFSTHGEQIITTDDDIAHIWDAHGN